MVGTGAAAAVKALIFLVIAFGAAQPWHRTQPVRNAGGGSTTTGGAVAAGGAESGIQITLQPQAGRPAERPQATQRTGAQSQLRAEDEAQR